MTVIEAAGWKVYYKLKLEQHEKALAERKAEFEQKNAPGGPRSIDTNPPTIGGAAPKR